MTALAGRELRLSTKCRRTRTAGLSQAVEQLPKLGGGFPFVGGLLNWVKRVPTCNASAPSAIAMCGHPVAHPALVAAFLVCE